MIRPSVAFTMTSFAPVPLLLGAAFGAEIWAWVALIYLTVFAFLLDELIGAVADPEKEFPAADYLSIVLGIAHFVVLGCVIWRFGLGITASHGIALFLAAGLFMGQIGNANAHELIHKTQRGLHRLGKWVYISLLFGHHTSAHALVHHRYVASLQDPNTARFGESYYRFILRAWKGSFYAGLAAESARHDGRKHPYVEYTFGALMTLIAAFSIGGWSGGLIFLGLAVFAQMQLLMSDYVQHYGLTRASVGDRLEPVGPQHSWNAPHVFSSHMLLNAPRHSAHHTKPSTGFNALDLPDPGDAPMLPYSLPAMSVIALVPPLWRHVIDPRLAYWQTRPLSTWQLDAEDGLTAGV